MREGLSSSVTPGGRRDGNVCRNENVDLQMALLYIYMIIHQSYETRYRKWKIDEDTSCVGTVLRGVLFAAQNGSFFVGVTCNGERRIPVNKVLNFVVAFPSPSQTIRRRTIQSVQLRVHEEPLSLSAWRPSRREVMCAM